MNRLALILLLLVFSSNSADAQNITGVTGTVSDGSTLVISGSGFGTKTTAAPWIFERFEAGTPFSFDLTSSPGDIDPHISEDDAYCGSRSLQTELGLPDGSSETIGRNGYAIYPFPHALVDGEKLYLSFKQKWSWGIWRCTPADVLPYAVPAVVSYQIKNWRISSGGAALDSPNIGQNLQSDCNNALGTDFDPRAWTYRKDGGGTYEAMDYFGPEYAPEEPFLEGEWLHWQIQVQQSTSASGSYDVWMSRDGIAADLAAYRGYTHLSADPGFVRILLGDWIDGLGGYTSFLWDDFYADNSWARVVLGDAATIDACVIIEMQTPTIWSANSITASVNTGLFTTGETVYLFVYDSDGNVSADGFPITIAGTTTSTEIAPPSNLRIDNR
jgi:hypothetical protein